MLEHLYAVTNHFASITPFAQDLLSRINSPAFSLLFSASSFQLCFVYATQYTNTHEYWLCREWRRQLWAHVSRLLSIHWIFQSFLFFWFLYANTFTSHSCAPVCLFFFCSSFDDRHSLWGKDIFSRLIQHLKWNEMDSIGQWVIIISYISQLLLANVSCDHLIACNL